MLNKQTLEKLYELKLDGMAAAFKEQLTQPGHVGPELRGATRDGGRPGIYPP